MPSSLKKVILLIATTAAVVSANSRKHHGIHKPGVSMGIVNDIEHAGVKHLNPHLNPTDVRMRDDKRLNDLFEKEREYDMNKLEQLGQD